MERGQSPQEVKLIATWSPGEMPVTRAPTCSTTPLPSWPRTAGVGKKEVEHCALYI